MTRPLMTRSLNRPPYTEGYALVTAIIAMVVLMAIVAVYMNLTLANQRDTVNAANSLSGFYAAEGGLNVRAEKVRAKFLDYNRPTGTSPTSAAPCTGANKGGGDFVCDDSLKLSGRTVTTYVLEPDGPDPVSGVVNPGETYAGLNYQQYTYRVISEAKHPNGVDTEAKLQLEFQSRLVPMFQFAAFYDKDLEINPGPKMTINGRVHTNSNLYLSPGDTLTVQGRVTAKRIFRQRFDSNACDGTVNIADAPSTTKTLSTLCNQDVSEADASKHNGYVKLNVQKLTVPKMSSLDPKAENELYEKADLRIVAQKVGNAWVLKVRRADGTEDTAATARLAHSTCSGALSMNPPTTATTGSFFDKRENAAQTLIEVDQVALMNCINKAPALTFRNPEGNTLKLDDTTGNGLVWHFSFDDGMATTNSSDPANKVRRDYGVRVKNAEKLGSDQSGAKAIKGLTIVANQAAYLQGDFNKDTGSNWRPASVLADTINILSSDWKDSTKHDLSVKPPEAKATEVNAAFLAGTDTTNTPTAGQYNGGLENYPRFHENWGGKEFKYRGSFVSLGEPSHSQGRWIGPCNNVKCVYGAPIRNWDYDSRFDDAANLPPLAPRFVYLRQLLFARDY